MFRRQRRPETDWVQAMLVQYEQPLLRYAYRLVNNAETAKEVVQETFLRLCDADAALVSDHPAEWLFTVCRNRAIDHQRKEKRMKVPQDSQALERVADTAPATANVLELRQAHSQILGALEALPQNQQEVVRLKFQNGLSYKEISRITGLSVTNVGFLLHTAMKTLRGSLGGDQ